MQNELYAKIHGALLAAAVGDSMGTVTEGFAPEFLRSRYGGYVRDLLQPTDDGLTVNARAGLVSDDFSVAYYTAQVLLEHQSRITTALAVEGLKRWWQHPEYTCYCGPSTRRGILKLLGEEAGDAAPSRLDPTFATNGGGMKAGMMGLFNPGDPAGAVTDAITMCLPTHGNPISLSAACAVAAAAARAFCPNTGYLDLIAAGMGGISQCLAQSAGRTAEIAGCSVARRLELAVELGLRCQDDFEQALFRIGDTVGAGLYAYEAVPAAFGILAACKGRLMDSLVMAVNMGSDADSTACMLGYVLGAWNGDAELPPHFSTLIDSQNGFDLEAMARGICDLAKEGIC